MLLGALVLSLGLPYLPSRWRVYHDVRNYGASAIVGLAFLVAVSGRSTDLIVLSGWSFVTTDSVAALTLRLDMLGLPFMMLTLLALFVLTLAYPPRDTTPAECHRVGSWLALGGGACLLYVAGNGLTLGYMILLCDGIAAFYWLRERQTRLGIARLFLGLVTAGGLLLTGLEASTLLSVALWLRIGLYPFIETTYQDRWPDPQRVTYLALTLPLGFYLVLRGVDVPLLVGLAVMTLLLHSILAWLSDTRAAQLSHLILAQASLMLFAGSNFDETIVAGFTIVLVLSLVTLWLTPQLGVPRLQEAQWSWPYIPALAATINLIGVPFTLGWVAYAEIYAVLLPLVSLPVIVISQMLALSAVWLYWLALWRGDEPVSRAALAGAGAIVPFLIPGFGPAMLGLITQTELPPVDFSQPIILATLGVVLIGAITLGYYRANLLQRFDVVALLEIARFRWLWRRAGQMLEQTGRLVLLVNVFLEGQHYIGWALLTGLVGMLVILFNI